ncbi:MAG: PAS domain-containing protein, partial [Verrucomicrobiota bacterium]
ERDLLRALMDSSPDPVYFKDAQSRFLIASKAHADIFGLKSADELLGKTDFDFFAEEHARPAFNDEQEIIRTGVPLIGKVEKEVLKNGRESWALTSKIPLRNKDGQIIGTFGISKDITAIKETEAKLEQMHEQLQWKNAFLEAQVNSSIEGIMVIDPQNRKILQNQRTVDLYKIPPDIAEDKDYEQQLRWITGIAKNPEHFVEKIRFLLANPCEISNDEIELKDGTVLERYSAPVMGQDGKYYGRLWTFRDITDRKRLEAQLFQSQKMETVGKLAGGIAHEFNSILTAIIGQSELLLGNLPAGSPLAKSATEISKAAGRAATLTRQLLAYGRKQFLQPEVLDLNRIVTGMENMLQHIIGGRVDTLIIPAPGLQAVKVDAGQIEQVIINMAVNAFDAMPNGGKLTLETANVSFGSESVGRYPELQPGDYVMLAITDNGTGMSAEVKARLFEPFFSTKGVGKGTGLGLSTCYGIIKQSGGHISVYSELGRGTTFKIYLPQVEPQTKIPVQRLDSLDLPRGTETILLVEDDPALREMAASLLRRLGYAVLTAANGIEALSLQQQRDMGHIDLLFTDVVMPQMSGQELADRVQALYPQTRILFTSAYTENAIIHQGVVSKGVAFLQKPFTPSALARKVREMLDIGKTDNL